MQELQTQERLWVIYAILSLMAAVTYWLCYWPRCYFFRARETNFLVAAEEQSKNLESQLPWAHKDWGGGGGGGGG